jgi:hypothetical protein
VVDGEAMTIHGLTVCVNYADFLERGIARWMAGLASLTVVTTPADVETQAVALAHGANFFATDLFTADGAVFNKGRAMEAARLTMPWSDWILFFDSDVVPPADWPVKLRGLIPGWLYGCHRFDVVGDQIEDRFQPNCAHDVPGVGFFQLFHASDPAVQTKPGEPLIDTHWIHGGNYDNRFMDRWRANGRKVRTVPFRVAHVGERENWFGRGNREAFEAMQAERKRRGGRWEHERIEVQS